MRSNGLATILLMIPVLTVPALAIFGVPQFAPVVASPLDEGRSNDRESRVGNSARQSHDDMFDDVEGFGSDSSTKEDPLMDRRDSTVADGNGQKSGSRSNRDSTVGWGSDLEAESPEPSQSRRRSSALDLAESETSEVSPSARDRNKSSATDRSSRKARRQSALEKTEDAIKFASTAEVDQGVTQAGFVENADSEKHRSAGTDSRSRFSDARNSKRRETSGEPLTWQAAVERLNELEIRNFRIEPAHQLGQFVFICSYTPPDSQRVSYRFEAEAEEPLKAVEKVLEQIVEWQQRR